MNKRRTQEKVHPIHISILVYNIQSGIVVFYLPNYAAAGYGTNGWISILFMSAIVMLNIFVISWLYRAGHGASVFDIVESRVSRGFAIPFYMIVVVLWCAIAAIVLKEFVLLIQDNILHMTPNYILVGIMLLLALQLVTKGIYNIVKASTIFFGLTVWVIVFLLFSIQEIDLVRYTPFIFQGGSSTLKYSFQIYSAFIGFELCMLLFPFVSSASQQSAENLETQPKTKLFKAMYLGNLYTTAIYLTLTIVSFGFYNAQELANITTPTVYLFSYFQLPFVERIDLLLFSLYLPKLILTVVMYLWGALQCMERIYSKRKSKLLATWIVIFSYVISLVPILGRTLMRWMDILFIIEICLSFGIPILLVLLLRLRKPRVQQP
ncbi:GerAB/ArcD/ProY family transporter [Paenibacillus terrigena]|uniref:GerAB/ArcD/ProY family transporter n=1 Tax=Paenibacillus terrigena TaxID=369333 RepID=UPI00037F33B0|nr:GerAB/ArcD/ProY family transporter [Paenibacillus terrigena]